MKALVLKDVKKMAIETIDVPAIRDDEVLIKVKYCGICGTDVHIYNGEPGSATVIPPVILGHEFAGEVVKVGKSVRTIARGDHVAVDPNIYCGSCKYCRQGKVQLCEHLAAVGVTRNGGMAEYCAVPATTCLRLDDEVPFQVGAMVEPLSCVLHGFDVIDPITPATKVLIIGGGFIGSLFLQTVCGKSPAKVAVCEVNTKKHRLLKNLGADHVYVDTAMVNETFDLVIECVGKKETSEAAVALAAKGANVLLFGVPAPDAKLTLPAFDIYSKELKILGSFINPLTLFDAVSMIDLQQLDIVSLLSHVITLEEVPEILGAFHNQGITKAIIKIS